MAKTKTLPKTLHIKVEGEGDESYFVADANLFPLVEMGVKTKIGVYQLIEITEAEGVVQTSRTKR